MPVSISEAGAISLVVAVLMTASSATDSALAESSVPAALDSRPQLAGNSERSSTAKRPPRKGTERPIRSGEFIHEIMDSIRARSGDLCARYGGPTDCLDEAEVCLTMRDDKDSYIRL